VEARRPEGPISRGLRVARFPQVRESKNKGVGDWSSVAGLSGSRGKGTR